MESRPRVSTIPTDPVTWTSEQIKYIPGHLVLFLKPKLSFKLPLVT